MDSEVFVFISYARRDREFVDRLASDLRSSGVMIWRDVDEIVPGQNWVDIISVAVKEADVLLFISSTHSAQSEWMQYEVKAAFDRGVPTIPVIIDDSGAQNIPEVLHDIQWVDFRPGYQQAFEQLLSALPGHVRHEQPIEETTHLSKGYIFLSYVEEDSSFVDRLKSFLEERKYAYWDYRESPRDYHRQFSLELEDAITEAVAMLSVLSPDWKNSEWTAREFFFSEQIGVPVFLLKARELGPTLAIAGRPYIDFVDSLDEGLLELDRELKRKGL